METIINKIENDWKNVKNKCRTTVGKEYTDNEPSSEFNRKLLISEHSPIRLIAVDWSWKNIKSWVSVHWSRHKWECFIQTQRTDRTQVNRDEVKQSAPVNFDGYANAQQLIDTMRKRLCYQASKETRELAEDLKKTLMKQCPELGEVLVPNCVYRCGCPEFKTCGYWNHILKRVSIPGLPNDKKLLIEDFSDIAFRYELYNEDFFKC